MQSMRKQALIISLGLFFVVVNIVSASTFSFDDHWRFPLSLQGKPPINFSSLESSLMPSDCGTCHKQQYLDWKTSIHSQSMGEGVTGQLHEPWLDDENRYRCLYCHAPLAEQSPIIKEDQGFKKNKFFNSALKLKGITCAGCHMRGYVRFGPTPKSGEKINNAPHNSFTEVEKFGDSNFCKPCHQFNPDDTKVNGKLLQNTYEEWKNSPYPSKGVHCTDCHMPKRRHLWKGIHSVQMVKSGVSIDTVKNEESLIVRIKNTGVGHNFPTYVTPKVVVKIFFIDKDGKKIKGTVNEKYIGRDISLDLSQELYDTRVAPGKTFKADFSLKGNYKAKKLKLEIKVYPDGFYNRFYTALIESKPTGVDINKMKGALRKTIKSVYTIYERSWDVSYQKKGFDYIIDFFK